MKNFRIISIDFSMLFKALRIRRVTLFVTLLSIQLWANPKCLSVIEKVNTNSADKVSIKMSLDEIWLKIRQANEDSNGLLILQPNPAQILELTYRLSIKIKERLESIGYTTELVKFKDRSDLKNYVPARWGVKIIKANASTWMGRVINQSILKTEIEFYFDPYGLYRNGTEGSADYTGVTEISFGINHIQKLNSNFIDSLLHELHHGSNHKKLKAQDPSGIYAEVNSLYTSKDTPQHQFSNEYPYYFHFHELSAYLKEISQIRSQLKQIPFNSTEYLEIKKQLDYYVDTYQKLYSEALQIIELAASTFLTEAGRRDTTFFIDSLHKNATAQILIKKPGDSVNSFKFTIWTPGITMLNHDAKSYKVVFKEILSLKEKILNLGPIRENHE